MIFSDKRPRILVIRTDRIGDTVLSIPVFELIKKVFPGSYLAVLVQPYTAPLIENNPFVDKVISDDRKNKHKGMSGFLKLASEIQKERFDVGIVLFSTPRVASLLKLSAILSVGPASKIEQFLYNKSIRQRRSQGKKHESEYNMDIALEGIRCMNSFAVNAAVDMMQHIKPHLFVTKKEERNIHEILEGMGVGSDEKIVVVHPGSGGSAINWSPERYSVVCDEIRRRTKAHVIVTWGVGEKEVINKLNKATKTPFLEFGGKNRTLRNLIALLKRADVLLTSSTGPLHIAGAVGTQTVSIFCPIRVCLPSRWGPLGYDKQHRIFTPDVPVCEGCNRSKCEHSNCMDLIPSENVVTAVVYLL